MARRSRHPRAHSTAASRIALLVLVLPRVAQVEGHLGDRGGARGGVGGFVGEALGTQGGLFVAKGAGGQLPDHLVVWGQRARPDPFHP